MNKVRALIVEKSGNVRRFASEYGYEYATLNRQVTTGKFTMAMIKRIVADLNIEVKDIGTIFFN